MKRVQATLVGAILFGGITVSSADTGIRIALIGDSTVTDRAGWGKAFAGRFQDKVEVLNFSVGGRSAKSWYDENRLPEVLKFQPDYVLIQFGHNGQPGKGPTRETDPATTYRDYLGLYVSEFRKIGAIPIIVSSVTRRTFDEHEKIASTLTPWAEASAIVAENLKVPFVDLHTLSVQYHNKVGREESVTFSPKEGDRTHYNKKGAEVIANLVVAEIRSVAPGLAGYLEPSGE